MNMLHDASLKEAQRLPQNSHKLNPNQSVCFFLQFELKGIPYFNLV